MTNFLYKLFVKNRSPQSPAGRTAYGKLSSSVGIFCNIILFAGKLTAGLVSGSVSITADAVNNLSDASSSIISLLGFKLASRPADPEHPYGHGRYEYLSALFISIFIILIGFELLKSGVDKIIHPENVEFNFIFAGILVFSILLKLWMMFFNTKTGRLINSQTLIATATDSRNDVIATAAVLAASLISYFTGVQLDGYMGVAVSLFILYSGVMLIRDTLDPLLGKAPDRELVEEIRKKILSYPGVISAHDLMVHDYGPGRQFASVHVEMSADADVIESHDVLDNIERDFLQNMGIHMVVHYDPISTNDSFTCEMRKWLSEQVKSIDSRMTIHDLRVVHGTTHTNVIFDCVAPHGIGIEDSDLKKKIDSLVKSKYPYCNTVITIDRSFTSIAD